jgi:hypothetical protein
MRNIYRCRLMDAMVLEINGIRKGCKELFQAIYQWLAFELFVPSALCILILFNLNTNSVAVST